MLTLFENGTVLTMDESNPVAEALLIRDGRVALAGKRKELMELCGGERPRAFDMGGGTLLPGFIDGHGHIVHTAQSLLFAPLGEARTADDVVNALNRHAHERAVPPGEWVIGTGYDPRAVRLNRRTLDRASGHPVLVTAASGHAGCMNSRALEMCQITKDTPDPPTGRIGRDESGEPNGYLEEGAFEMARAHVPPPSMARLREGLAAAQRLYASHGVTTAQEGLLDAAGFALLKEADESDRLFLDVAAYADIRNPPPGAVGLRGKRLRVLGYKLFLDGSPQGRTAWLSEPYLPVEKGERGYPAATQAQARAAVRRAAREGVQLLTHCNGDAAIDRLLDVHQEKSRTRNVIVHAQLMRRDQLPRVKALGLMPSCFVAHVDVYGDTHIENLGLERASRISPLKSTCDMGIPFTLHQDSPVMPPNMLHTLYCAMARYTRGGALLGADERIGLHEALKAVTVYGAYQHFEENEKGALRPGMRADLVLAEGDIRACPPEELANRRVKGTWKDGGRVFTDK